MRISVEAPAPLRPFVERAHSSLGDALISSLGLPMACGLGIIAAVGLILGATRPGITADEGTALSTAKAAAGGMHQWIEILAPPIQVALYVPFFVFSDPKFAIVVPALFGALLLLLVVAVAWRLTGLPWAGAVSGMLLLSSSEYWQRSSLLPAYQAFVFFGYLGLFLIALACRSTRRTTALAVGGGVALAFSACTFTSGLLFLPLAFLPALAWKTRLRSALLGPAVAGALLLPFAVWHVAVAGVRNAWLYPHNFILVEYSEDLQRFRNQPGYDLGEYVTRALPDMLLGAAPAWLWLLAGAGLFMIVRAYGARVSAAMAGAILVTLLPFVAVEQPPYARYGYFLVPGVVLVAGVGFTLAVQSLARRQAARHLLIVGMSLLAMIGASTAVWVHLDRVRAERASTQYAELQAVAGRVDDQRGLLARTSYLQVLLPDNQIYTHFFFSEDEYLDYVLWEDEEKVRRLFADREIGWVVFQKNVARWERDFNWWAFTATGSPPRHYACLPQSAGFTEVYDSQSYTLYRVEESWLQSKSVSGTCVVSSCELQAMPGAWRLESGQDGNHYCESP